MTEFPETANCDDPGMRRRLNTYTAYSIGCGVVWAAILAGTRKKANFDHILLAFAGWASGWTSATIARHLYPPPRSERLSH